MYVLEIKFSILLKIKKIIKTTKITKTIKIIKIIKTTITTTMIIKGDKDYNNGN